MKTKVLRSAKYATLILMLLLIGYSCSDDIVGLQSKVAHIPIKKSDWKWDDDAGKYYAIVNLPELSFDIYENKSVNGYVFIGTQGVDEVQEPLPFVYTYREDDGEGGEIIYTETIRFNFMYGSPSTAAFYIQGSDLGRDDSILANYDFKLVFHY